MNANYNFENISREDCLENGRKYAKEMKLTRTIIEKMIAEGENPKSYKIQGAIKVYERAKKNLIHYAQTANSFRNI